MRATTAALSLALCACGAAAPEPQKSSARVRAERRAYDGAPPVIPHRRLSSNCTSCHNERGMAIDGIGFAPATPHASTRGMGDVGPCQQCHVFRSTEDELVRSTFAGVQQDLRRGERAYPGAPPVMPHAAFMRENCVACHTGPAARDQIRTSHPERTRCQQCHVEQRTRAAVVVLSRSGRAQ